MALDLRTGDLLKPEQKFRSSFTPNIFWKEDQEVHTLIFLTAPAVVPKVRLHTFVEIPDDSREKGFRYEDFLCRKDPSLIKAHGGQCELCDVIKNTASEKFVALAVELEPQTVGKKIKGYEVMMNEFKDREGNEKSEPRWGILKQGRRNFFNLYAAQVARLNDQQDLTYDQIIFEIQRVGKDTGTQYLFSPVTHLDVPDLSEYLPDIPDLLDILEDMASDEKYAQLSGVEPQAESETTEPAASDADVRNEFERIKAEIAGAAAQ